MRLNGDRWEMLPFRDGMVTNKSFNLWIRVGTQVPNPFFIGSPENIRDACDAYIEAVRVCGSRWPARYLNGSGTLH